MFSIGGRGRPSAQLLNEDPEAWDFRGGLSGEFQVIKQNQNRLIHYQTKYAIFPLNKP